MDSSGEIGAEEDQGVCVSHQILGDSFLECRKVKVNDEYYANLLEQFTDDFENERLFPRFENGSTARYLLSNRRSNRRLFHSFQCSLLTI